MASEYLKWLARDVKPEEKKELTPEEKRKNWWQYNKWVVAAVVAALVVIVWLSVDGYNNRRTAADYQVAYVGSGLLPDDTAAAVEAVFAQFGEDLTGDGVVRVMVRQFVLENDPMKATELMLDLSSGQSVFYLLEDPASFQETYGALSYRDGVFAEDAQRSEPLWYAWDSCAALTTQDLGSYRHVYNDMEVAEGGGENRDLLAGLYLARRGNGRDTKHPEQIDAMWQKIVSGAE